MGRGSFDAPAGAALVLAVVPWLFFGALALISPAGRRDLGEIVLTGVVLVIVFTPLASLALAVATVRRLRALDDDERPSGLTIARVARTIALVTIVVGTLFSLLGVRRGRAMRTVPTVQTVQTGQTVQTEQPAEPTP